MEFYQIRVTTNDEMSIEILRHNVWCNVIKFFLFPSYRGNNIPFLGNLGVCYLKANKSSDRLRVSKIEVWKLLNCGPFYRIQFGLLTKTLFCLIILIHYFWRSQMSIKVDWLNCCINLHLFNLALNFTQGITLITQICMLNISNVLAMQVI